MTGSMLEGFETAAAGCPAGGSCRGTASVGATSGPDRKESFPCESLEDSSIKASASFNSAAVGERLPDMFGDPLPEALSSGSPLLFKMQLIRPLSSRTWAWVKWPRSEASAHNAAFTCRSASINSS